jgi:hypothetical protein
LYVKCKGRKRRKRERNVERKKNVQRDAKMKIDENETRIEDTYTWTCKWMVGQADTSVHR